MKSISRIPSWLWWRGTKIIVFIYKPIDCCRPICVRWLRFWPIIIVILVMVMMGLRKVCNMIVWTRRRWKMRCCLMTMAMVVVWIEIWVEFGGRAFLKVHVSVVFRSHWRRVSPCIRRVAWWWAWWWACCWSAAMVAVECLEVTYIALLVNYDGLFATALPVIFESPLFCGPNPVTNSIQNIDFKIIDNIL